MTLEWIDTDHVITELLAIKNAFACTHEDDIAPDQMSQDRLMLALKRLRALLPKDPDMAENVAPDRVWALLGFLDELRAAIQVGNEGVIYADQRYADTARYLMGQFESTAVMVQDDKPSGRRPPKRPRATVDMRMLEAVATGAAEHGWTCRQWAEYLKCSHSAVADTATWDSLKAHRLALKAARAKDRHHRGKNR